MHSHEATYIQIVPARPPLINEKTLLDNIETHVDIVVVARPRTESDLRLPRSSCFRPIRAMSHASASAPVVRLLASMQTRSSACKVTFPAGTTESAKPLTGCISWAILEGMAKKESVD